LRWLRTRYGGRWRLSHVSSERFSGCFFSIWGYCIANDSIYCMLSPWMGFTILYL
jgi:hypothetical protein